MLAYYVTENASQRV